MRKLSALLLAVLLAATLWTSAVAEDGTILLGMTIPMTGDYASSGLRATQGAKLAIKEINEAGGIDGQMLKLQVEDDQGNSDLSVQMVNKLASDGVVAILGPYFSGATIAVADSLTANGVMCINGSTAATVRKLENPWVFRARATDDINVRILAKAAIEAGATKVGILCVNDEVGKAAADLYMAYFDEANIPYYYEGHNPSDVDMSSTLSKSVAEGCDAYVMSTHNNPVAIIARQMYELNIHAPVFTNPIIAQADVLALMEPEWVEGWKCVSDFSYTDSREVQKAFTEAFLKEYGTAPDIHAAVYYGCVKVVADAIVRAGSTDRQAVRDAVAQTQGLMVPVGEVNAASDQYTNMIFEISLAEIKDLTPVISETVSLLK